MRKNIFLLFLFVCFLSLLLFTSSSFPIAEGTNDDVHNPPVSIYNIDTKKYSGTPEEAARQYLLENRTSFGLKENLSDLEFLNMKESPAGYHVAFVQKVNGIQVLNSEVLVSMNKENVIQAISNNYRKNTANVHTSPSLSQQQAIDIAVNSIEKGKLNKKLAPKVGLRIFQDSDGNHLVWRIVFIITEPDDEYYLLIDAQSGDILIKRTSAFQFVDGTGRVFKPDPVSALSNPNLTDQNDEDYGALAPAYDIVTLKDLDNAVGGYYYVKGRYAESFEAYDHGISLAKEVSPNNFLYNRHYRKFDEVNAYYFIDDFRRYVGNFGFSPQWKDSLGIWRDWIRFDVNTTLNRYLEIYEYINFAGDSTDTSVDAGEDQSVIVHEYGHALHDALLSGGGLDDFNDIAVPLSEGISFYLGISYRRSLQQSPFQPNESSNWFSSAGVIGPSLHYPEDWIGTQWTKGLVWASTLMDIEEQTSRNVATKIILQSLSYITSNSSLDDNINALFQAEDALYGGTYYDELADVLSSRGFTEVSGTISENTTWYGNRVLTGNTTINNAVTLTISPGTEIFVDGSVSLIVNGTLDAVGTSNNHITFTSTSGTWVGIEFESGSNGDVKYADISNAVYAVNISSATPNIQNCNITGNSYGIRIYNSYSTDWVNDPIKDNVIENNSSYGIYLYNSSPTLNGNTVYSNNIGVALFTNCNSVVTSNNINSNDYYGFTCYGSSSPLAYYSLTYAKGGYNQFRWDGTEEVKITGTSNPNFGMGSYYGNNSLTNGLSHYLMYNTTSNTIVAERNWWGYSTGPQVSQLYGSIDYYPYLTSDPNGSQIVDKPSDENQTVTSDELSDAMDAFYKGNYQAAASLFREYIMKNYTEENIISVVQYYIISLSQVENKGSVISAVNQLKNLTMTPKAQADLSGLYAALLERNGNNNKAITELDNAVTNKATAENKNQLKLQKAHLLIHSMGQTDKGREILTQILNEESKESYLYEIASSELSVLESTQNQLLKSGAIATKDEEKPTEYALANNYPNPFNPTTVIKFQIPNDKKQQNSNNQLTNVVLKIYDILGREVAILVDERKASGNYEVTFNGSELTSGVYIYKLTAGSFTESKKMILMK